MGKEKAKNPDKIGFGKFWGWQLRGTSVGCVFIVLTYLTIYCTDTLNMPAILVGNLFLAAKIFDGVTDIIVGVVIDKTHTKWGKGRPYEFAVLGLWLCTWLLFTCSEGWSLVVKSIWVFCMYTFVNSIFYTICIANQTPYMIRAFGTQNQIVKLNSYGGIIVTIGCAIVSMVFPQLMATMATSAKGWSTMVGIFALPLALIGMLRFLLVKETIDIPDDTSQINFKGVIELLKNNKYVYVILLITLFYNFTMGLNVATYYFTYVVGDIGKYTYIAMLSMPMMIFMFIFPVAMRKFSVGKIMEFGAIIGVFGGVLNFLAGGNMPLLMIGAACISFAGLPIAYLMVIMIVDCANYNEMIGRPRMDALVSAFQSFGGKIGQGIGAAALGWILGLAAYDGSLTTQPASAIGAIKGCYGIAPALMYLFIAIIAHNYKLNDVLKEKAEKENV